MPLLLHGELETEQHGLDVNDNASNRRGLNRHKVAKIWKSGLKVAQSIFTLNLRQNYCATGGDHRFWRIKSRYYGFKKG